MRNRHRGLSELREDRVMVRCGVLKKDTFTLSFFSFLSLNTPKKG